MIFSENLLYYRLIIAFINKLSEYLCLFIELCKTSFKPSLYILILKGGYEGSFCNPYFPLMTYYEL